MHLFDLPLFFQFLAALLSCFFLIKKKTDFLKYLTFLLVLTFLVELTGAYLKELRTNNFWLYHVYTVIEFITIFFIYKYLIKDNKYLRVSYLILFCFVILWSMVFFEKKYFFYAVVVGSFNVGVLVFLYLRELLLSNEIINYKKLLPFWVSVGFLVFFLPTIPFFSFWNYLKGRQLMPILNSLIILMNILISFGLVWSNRRVEY